MWKCGLVYKKQKQIHSENLGSIIFRTMANMNCDGWTLFYRISWYSSILSRRLRRHCSLTVQSFHRDFIWTKNRECHFLILKECTRNFCANNVNQMHKGNFIKYRTHSSLKWHFSYQGTDIHIGDHQILHKLGNFGQNNVVEIIIMNGVTEYVIHRLFSGQSTRFHNWNENIVDSSKYFQHFICLVQTSYESRTVIFQKFPQCDSWE